jgi:RNA polymerase sigma factor (sigma-70 family)
MDERDWLERRFEEHRTRLRAVAYRMLGSLSEADDAVQEAWLRLSRTDASEVENLRGWLTTVVARISLDMLRSRKARREEPLGVHMPEPILDRADGMNPEHEALLADSVGLALLVVLETLSPPERLAFVLHDIFAVPFDEIAPIVNRSPEAARQLASRARRRVRAERTVPDADLERQREVVDAFLAAARDGDFDRLLAVVASGVSQALVTRVGVKPILAIGMGLLGGGLAYFTQVSPNGSYVGDLLPGFLLIGVGLGFAFVPVSIAALAGIDGHDAGLASGLINTSQQIGGAIGLAVLATVATTRTENLLAGGTDPATALTSGFQIAFWVGVGLAVASLIATLVVLRGKDLQQTGEPVPVPA